MAESVLERVAQVLGCTPQAADQMGGGCVGEVYRLRMASGGDLVAKVDRSMEPTLAIEAFMLRYLAKHTALPVPEVLFSDERLLIMTYVAGRNYFSKAAQIHAAELLAELHSISAPQYGFERDTLIGSLHQPNPPTERWLDFFREYRLLHMGRRASGAGRLPSETYKRLETFCGHLDRWLIEPPRPALIHGDAWGGNILGGDNRIVAFLDPAIYFADPEIELAFTTLFGTFGSSFFARYEEIHPLEPGFHEVRRDIYNLYPLLVHTLLFGGSYAGSVAATLARLGF